MKRKKMSVKWRLFLVMFGFTVFMLALIWFFQIAYLNNFYKIIKKHELRKAASELLEKFDADNLEWHIKRIASDYDISINLTDSRGRSIYNANIMENSHIYIFSDEQFDAMYGKAKSAGGTVMYEVSGRYRENNGGAMPDGKHDISFPHQNTDDFSGFDGGFGMGGSGVIFDMHGMDAKSMVYTRIITDTDGNEYVLFANSLITPVDATVHTLRVQFVYISVIFVIVTLIVAFVISRHISKPIMNVNESAKKLAEGNFDVKFEGGGYREVRELSETLNYAAVELGRTGRLQKDLIANVSHDLRTPLTMITAYSEVMRDLPGENTPENAQVIIDESRRLTTLVNDMLDLSKLQAGVTELNAEEFDFTASILAVMKRFSKLTEQSGYTINFEYADDVKVYADEFKIHQVIYNLINNAINYAGEDKTVIVRQKVRGETVRLEVEDHGMGIAGDELANIWDRYYKVDKNHRRAIQGSGIGLSIVQNILKLHNAKYGVDSTEGSGCVFWFELKIVKEEE